jgi:hypothetical protein
VSKTSTIRFSALRPNLRIRLHGLALAVRFASIPLACAALVALLSEETPGRAIAAVVAAASLVLGVAVHFRAVILGRSNEPQIETPLSWTGEWLFGAR